MSYLLDKDKHSHANLTMDNPANKNGDDKGYWNQIEVYIHDHSEAEFTHGICPECAKKLYPKYYKD